MQMPKVDIIIPAYNAARFLPAALESVLAQTFTDWRILLVDDGSTDHTSVIAAQFKQRMGDKLIYIKQENRGLPAARNSAIRHASAEFLALLDADDVWLPDRLAESLQRFDRPEVGLVYGFVSRVDVDGNLVTTHDEMKRHAEGRIASSIYMRSIDLPCPTITFRRECIDLVGEFDESMRATEDRDLWLRIAQHYEVARVPKVIAFYRISPGAMTSDTERMFHAQQRFLAKHYGSPGCDRSARRIATSSIYRQRAEILGVRWQRYAALKSILQALMLHPADRKNLRAAVSLLLLLFRRSLNQ
jgi:cellulose synthase/poly-beta-1,6-N-acetylglucosamine synthase-like glycosyltransferase